MKKYLVLFLVILCCGCSAKYNINFIDDKITDEIVVSYERYGETDDDIEGLFYNTFSLIHDSDKFYSFKNLSTDENVIGKLSYEFNASNYDDSYIPNSCFESFRLLDDDDKYYLFAQGAFKCDYYAYEELDSLDIVINTNHAVLENNADEVSNNKYVWHIDPNSDNVNIKFVVKKKTAGKLKIKNKGVLVLFGSIGVFCFCIASLVFLRYKRLNKF